MTVAELLKSGAINDIAPESFGGAHRDATYLLSTGIKGTSSMKLHRNLGITQKTSRQLAHRIRETWERTS